MTRQAAIAPAISAMSQVGLYGKWISKAFDRHVRLLSLVNKMFSRDAAVQKTFLQMPSKQVGIDFVG
ncbi:hypothetical protein [uncultured Tateyamaria sp.]|uniref:hypothetical protein n=1 Tax=uncultured Tateyamaria sp. TaxID=455651 RepID=UPI002610C5F8|nr:hypothetical protein [uncultured Tateyamaria sp.]